MKYKIAGMAAAVCMVGGIWLLSQVDTDNARVRIHQHQTPVPEECDCDGSKLCTHLPLVVIDTGGQEIPGAVNGSVAQWNMLEDEAAREKAASMGIPGAESASVIDDLSGEKYTLTEDGSAMLPVNVRIMDDPDRRHHTDDVPDVDSGALIRIRGNTSVSV